MALESGRVNSYREAVIAVRLSNGSTIECVLDTGFDGGLMLPEAFVSAARIPIIGELTFQVVGGSTLSAPVGLTEIDWLAMLRQVEVIVSQGEDALIGTELLIGSTLVVDYPSSSLTISMP